MSPEDILFNKAVRNIFLLEALKSGVANIFCRPKRTTGMAVFKLGSLNSVGIKEFWGNL